MRTRKGIMVLALLFVIIFTAAIFSKEAMYQLIEIENISRYNEDRIVFQHIEETPVEYEVDLTDNSIAALLIVKDKKIYLFKDGYDNPGDVATQGKILAMENQLLPDLWKNKIDNKPDYLRITDRRVEIMKRQAKADGAENERNLEEKFVQFYDKVKTNFITQHVNIFKALMINRKDSGLNIERKPLPKKLVDISPTRYFTSVTAKTIDEKVYYAEDADGDGLTETFTVTIPDGFDWGYKSGPNILCISGCRYKDSDGKEINVKLKELIGNLTKDAYYGTAEEARIIEKTFLKDTDVDAMIKDLYQLPPEEAKLMKEVQEGSK